MQRRSILKVLAAAVAVLAVAGGASAQGKPELSKIHIGVGGKAALYYLPLSITERLGYFKEEGLEVLISDLQGGSKTMQALVGGSIDIASGAYEHAIHIQPKGQTITAFVMQGRYPGFALGIAKARAQSYKSPKDLKGLKIGVTSPGAGTQTFVEYLLAKDGLKSADVSFVGVGSGSTGAAAIRAGKIDAISNIDPLMTELETTGDVTILVDTRTTAGTMAVFGTAMPAGTLYTQKSFIEKNPRTVQALANAMVRSLLWIQKATPQQIGEAVPAAYHNNNRDLYLAAFARVREGISPDGLFPRDGVENTLKMLRDSDPAMRTATIRLEDTYTNRFVEEALKTLRK
ncbi:MAG: ABC transporter substrate-binding protein [Betaproteobacteria bacterium]|nr:ABC transporter substrate-binding protein [Betaproteobacteria bacterium]